MASYTREDVPSLDDFALAACRDLKFDPGALRAAMPAPDLDEMARQAAMTPLDCA